MSKVKSNYSDVVTNDAENQKATDLDVIDPSHSINIHDEIKKRAPNLNEKFKAGDMYYAGNVYRTKEGTGTTQERVLIKNGGAVRFVIGSDIEKHFSKILKGVHFEISRNRYKDYSATNLRRAGLIT